MSRNLEERGGSRCVLFLVSSMQGGGAERVAAQLCNRWVEKGYRVILMPTYSQKGECRYQLDERVSLKYLADRVAGDGSRLWQRAGRFIALRRVMKEIEPDFVVSFLTRVNVAAIIAARGMATKVIVSERNNPEYDPAGRIIRLLRRALYRYADRVVVQTSFTEKWIRRNCFTRRVVTIPNPVAVPLPALDPVVDPSQYKQPGRRILLAVGRLVEQKNFAGLLEAFSRLAARFPDWDLVIVGEGPLKKELERTCRDWVLQDRVIFPGRVGNLSDWYDVSDIYVLSSTFEGFPNTLLEALAHGVPSVSFDCETGPRDLIEPGVNGLLVSMEQGAGGLSEALAVLMENVAVRKRMGSESRKAGVRFSMDRIDEEWSRIFEGSGGHERTGGVVLTADGSIADRTQC